MREPRHLALVGCTASGKSALAMAVARCCAGPPVAIVSADSMQVYRGMDIGTAKPTRAERAEVPHHLLDVADPSEDFSVARYQIAAAEALAEIEERGHRALLVGGTGLYVRAVVDALAIPGRWPEVRAALDREPDVTSLHRRLAELDPVAATRMEPSNRRRVARALEVSIGSGRPFSSYGPGLEAYPPSAFDLVGIELLPKVVSERIADRYERQLAEGLVDEVKAVACARPSRTARQALGYRELLAYLSGDCSLDEAVDQAVRRTRRFARRQRAWFRRDPRITWLRPGVNPLDAMPELLGRWAA